MSEPRIREATLADVDALAQLRAATWGPEPYWQERIRGYMNGTRHPQQALAPRVVMIAEEQTQAVGLIAGHLTQRYGCDGELQWIDVSSDRRRSGLAESLLRSLATWFQAHGARRVCVDVDPENAPARAFYRKHGAEDLNRHWLVWPDITALADAS